MPPPTFCSFLSTGPALTKISDIFVAESSVSIQVLSYFPLAEFDSAEY